MAREGGDGSQPGDGARAGQGASNPRIVLADQILTGEQVLQSVRMIGDQQDAAVWQVNRKTWIDRTAAALEEAFPQAVDDFRIACHATVRGHWRTVFQAEVRALEEGLRLISSLLGTVGSGS